MTQEVESTVAVRKRKCFFLLGPLGILMSSVQALTTIVLTDLIVYRTCLVTLKYNSTECLMLRTNSGSPEAANLEVEAEPHASLIVMTKTLIENLVPAVLTLFLGPWSDRGGRKPLFLAAISGYTLTYVSFSLMCDWNISPWYLLISSIPYTIVGGLCTLTLSTTCYISDTTTEKDRMVQLTLLEASINGGSFLGTLIGPLIYKSYGYANVFRTAAICSTLALAYVYFCIPETAKKASKESIRGLLDISSVKDLIKRSFLKRDHFNRSIIWIGISTFTLHAMVLSGLLTIEFLFTRVRLGWGVSQYSSYSAVGVVLRIIGMCLISLFTSLLGLSDTFVAGLALVSALGGAITRSLVWQSWHIYLAMGIEIFVLVTGPALRSIISKSVPAEDVGKVFSVTAFFEASALLIGSPVFTMIYSNYLPPVYPSPVFMLSTSVYASLIICVISIHVLLRKSRRLSTYIPASQEEN